MQDEEQWGQHTALRVPPERAEGWGQHTGIDQSAFDNLTNFAATATEGTDTDLMAEAEEVSSSGFHFYYEE